MVSRLPECAVIGERLRTSRLASGISINVLAGVLGIEPPQLLKYERGENRLPVAYAVRLAKMMGVSPLNLMPGQDARIVRLNNRLARINTMDRDIVLQTFSEILDKVEQHGA